jgi:ATP-dependent helicase/nuclease subunit A
MSNLADQEARRRITTEFDSSFIVEAAAGTGKTTALIDRIVGLVRSGNGSLAGLVAVTFTEKAAGEMKLRLRGQIEKARASAQNEERTRFETALEQLELARITTIHAFCGDLLRERPVEAAIDPLFEVAPESEVSRFADEAFDSWFQRILDDPPDGIRRILRRRSRGQTPREQLRGAMQSLLNHRDFPEAWRRDPFDRVSAIDRIMEELTQLGNLAAASSWAEDYLARNLTEIDRFVEETGRLEAVRGRDYDGLEAEFRSLIRARSWSWKGSTRTTFGALPRDEVLDRRDQAKAQLEQCVARSDADIAPLIHEALQAPIADYETLKARAGRLDFLDLLIKARDLIRDKTEVRHELQQRFRHIFVDEFQDTDPLQAEILLLLAADDPDCTDWLRARPLSGKLFLVGDPKQSIYRFRRADVALYEEVKEHLLGIGIDLLYLTTSFRAPPSIQSCINGAFATAIVADREAGQADYVGLQPSRSDITGQPTIVALPVPRPYGDYGKITNWQIDGSLPEAVGAFVSWLLNESGWKVDEDGASTSVQARHIAILFRRLRNYNTDVARAYVQALEARRIAHVLVGGRSFHDREEVIALRNALTAIEWPDDELRVFATLRGPFFALSDEALLAFRQSIDSTGALSRRRLNPMSFVDRDALDPLALDVADALALLRSLHSGRNQRPIAETITLLLEAVRAHAGIALWPTGEQALANCQRLIDMARQFEGSASSFRSFVEKLEADAERGEVDEAPVVEEGTEGVRIMTVHKAKGLEFPVVILADPTCPAIRDTAGRHIDTARGLWVEPLCGSSPIELLEANEIELKREETEALRLAYVAATRARDLLVIPVCGDEPIEGWLSVLDPMLYPPLEARRLSGPALACPTFGEDSVLDRGSRAINPPPVPVRPGVHESIPNGVPVVWWDPAVLVLDVEELAPVRHQRILEPDPGGTAAAESEANYAAWKRAHQELLAQASAPTLSVKTITSIARDAAQKPSNESDQYRQEGGVNGSSVSVEVIERANADRAKGRRFGTLVHAVLASIDLNADFDTIKRWVITNGRLVAATEEEIEAAVETVRAALAHPVSRRAAAAAAKGKVRREVPVVLRQEDGGLAEGTVDLAFLEDGPEFTGWTIVDFKTDRDLRVKSRYVAQLTMYVEAISAATGSFGRGTLLLV